MINVFMGTERLCCLQNSAQAYLLLHALHFMYADEDS